MKNSRTFRRALQLLWRGWCLRCPRCAQRTLFRRWLTMHEHCASCHWRFEREQGYFLGAMYLNYALTVCLVLVGYFVLEWCTDIALVYHLVLWGSLSLLVPLLLFRRSRGIWLSFDYFFNPTDDIMPQACEEWGGEEG